MNVSAAQTELTNYGQTKEILQNERKSGGNNWENMMKNDLMQLVPKNFTRWSQP